MYLQKKHPLFSSLASLLLGALLILSIQKVFADTVTIYACVKTNTGFIKIVPANTTCANGETLLSWNQVGPQGPTGPTGPQGPAGSGYFGLPFICNRCILSLYAAKFAGQDFSNAQIDSANFDGATIQGVIFKGGDLSGTSFVGADLTNADLSNLPIPIGVSPGEGTHLFSHNANLTNVNFTNDNLNNSDFTNANLQSTNFTNAVLSNVDLTGASNMSTANITGVTWVNTTCPDGTNSDAHGSTCAGHF